MNAYFASGKKTPGHIAGWNGIVNILLNHIRPWSQGETLPLLGSFDNVFDKVKVIQLIVLFDSRIWSTFLPKGRIKYAI